MRARIATLNVWGLPEPLSQGLPERLAAIARRLPELAADVVAVQEAWAPSARRVLVEAAASAGLRHSWCRGGSLAGSGLLVLSRFPIVGDRFVRYALRGLPQNVHHGDYYGGKGFAELTLRTDAGDFSLIDTHLHARYASDVAHEYLAIRTGQVVELALRARGISGPLVVLGDFNFRETDPEHTVLTGLTGLGDVAAVAGRRQPTVLQSNPYRIHSSKPDRRIDYVFAQPGRDRSLRIHSIERTFDETLDLGGRPGSYSDHAGLLADLEWRAGTRASAPSPIETALELARTALAQGRADAARRRGDGRMLAGAGIGAAVAAAAGMRRLEPVSRRRLLRGALHMGALAALTPSVAVSYLSEVAVPDEIAAFERLEARLARVEREAKTAV